jgi:RNA polymerase sigma factor (sigma-70 family)
VLIPFLTKLLSITEPMNSYGRLTFRERGKQMYVKIENFESSTAEIHHLPKEEQLISLMEEYGDMVVRLAFTYVKQKQLAEDISQEVFISCYKSLDRFQNKATYKTWLYRITVNKCKDLLKSWSFKNIYYKDVISSLIKNGTNPSDASVIEKEEKEWVFERVLTLPIKLREVVILHYYEELSITDISVLIGINSNTVKTRLHRARSILKNSLKGESFHGR